MVWENYFLSDASVSRCIRWGEVPPPIIKGTCSTIREDVSRLYYLILDFVMWQMKCFLFCLGSSPSASRTAPTSMAGEISHFSQLQTSEYSKKMLPSPWLSTLMAIKTYLMVVRSVIVKMIRESEPTIKGSLIWLMLLLPSRMDFITYMGGVAISP